MELVITGWKPGVKTISLMDVLRKYGGMGLRQAKHEADALLAGEHIYLSGLDGETVVKARTELESLGCVCR